MELNEELKPCPFCGGVETRIKEETYWTGMRAEVISATVYHHCDRNEERPLQSYLQIKAKTKEEAIKLWNKRTF